MAFHTGPPAYLIAVFAGVPAVILFLALLALFILCSKRYRLNWYERTLLEEDTADQTGPLLSKGPRASLFQKGGLFGGCKGGLMSGGGGNRGGRGARTGSVKSEWLFSVRKMGSSPSSPTSDASEKFWVPPHVIERKRAQSLVPSLSRNDSDEDISPCSTGPSNISAFRDLSFAFASEKIPGTVMASDNLPSTPPPGYNPQRRRASMHDAIDFTKIDTKLYDKKQLVRQQSVSSLQEEQLGSLQLSMDYNQETSILTVTVIEARDIVSRDFSGTATPYVKVSLLPERRNVLQSKIQNKTVNPVFDEEFLFEVSTAKLPQTTLEVLVYDFDQFSRDECIGQVHVLLDGIDFSHKVTLWNGINPFDKKEQDEDFGDLMFSLNYLPSAERLTIVIAKARNLRHSEDGKITLDPFVKAMLFYGGKKLKKKKTSTKHNTCNPIWNEALVFNLSKEHLNSLYLDLVVFHDNKIGNDELLGKVRLGPDSGGDERDHWKDLVQEKSATARWHNLS
ncbi:synaptotagmin-5-like [Gigantopelta aegis]|uniref:synaptotagmin-5-like n=1 Tax=Gigantopelta aegis TaxID=1735272 RepID=UPI001B88AE88|nr:synaptotagmin-5-like [Gigantopelta aegis]